MARRPPAASRPRRTRLARSRRPSADEIPGPAPGSTASSAPRTAPLRRLSARRRERSCGSRGRLGCRGTTMRTGTVPGPDHPDRVGGTVRQVDHAAVDVGATVVDVHPDGAPVVQVGDHHPGAERQRAMRGREIVLVVALAARRAPAVEARGRTTTRCLPGTSPVAGATWAVTRGRCAGRTAGRDDQRPCPSSATHPRRIARATYRTKTR